jgi:hypothetical protein
MLPHMALTSANPQTTVSSFHLRESMGAAGASRTPATLGPHEDGATTTEDGHRTN